MEDKKTLSLFLHIDTERYNNFKEFEEIKDILNKHGFSLSYDQEENLLMLVAHGSSISRGAGRKKKYTHKKKDVDEYGYYSAKTMLKLSDIEEMQKRMTDEQIVSELNLSRSTFYRHLKKAKEKRTDKYDPYF